MVEIKKSTLIWIVIGILLVAALFITFKSANTGTTTGNVIDTTGWSENEIMNYEMHGTIPARVSGSSASSGSGMVGGC